MSQIAYSATSSDRSPWYQLASRHRAWSVTALVMLGLSILCLALSALDERMLNGVSVWTKPFKFYLSIAAYFVTLAWFAPLLPDGYFDTWRGRALTGVTIFCAAGEMLYITWQGALGEASHFNVTTPFHAMMYSLMGFGATVLVAGCLWMGSAILHHRGMREPFAFAVGVGLILTFVLGGGFGGYLGGAGSHWVDASPTDADGVWLFRWARDGGDLRVAHFFGLHAMQVLPLAALLIPRRTATPLAISIVIAVACAYAAFTTVTFAQALRGQPFIG